MSLFFIGGSFFHSLLYLSSPHSLLPLPYISILLLYFMPITHGRNGPQLFSGFTGERSNPQFLFHHSDNLLLRGESTVQWKEEMVLYLRLNLPSQYSTIIGVPRWWDAYVLANLIAPAYGFFFLSSVGLSTILYYPSFQLSTHYAVHNLFLFFSFLLLSLFYHILHINIYYY